MGSQLMLSVCCVTYNHENYIAQAIDGFLMQKTNFLFEIIIHDDASTDKTAEIIQKYAKIDNRIKPVLRTTNIRSTGVPVFPITFDLAKGKYIALCEGDDYWTDPDKLQKQVDFLENNSDFSYCCSRYNVLNEGTGENMELEQYKQFFIENTAKLVITKDNLFNPYISKTLTILIRYAFLPKENIRSPFYKDIFLFMDLLQKGNGACLNFNSGIYRVNNIGVWSKTSDEEKMKSNLQTAESMYKHFPKSGNEHLKKWYLGRLEGYCQFLLKKKELDSNEKKYLRKYYTNLLINAENIPQYFRSIFGVIKHF